VSKSKIKANIVLQGMMHLVYVFYIWLIYIIDLNCKNLIFNPTWHPSGTFMSSNHLVTHQTHKNGQYYNLKWSKFFFNCKRVSRRTLFRGGILEPPLMSSRVKIQSYSLFAINTFLINGLSISKLFLIE